MHLWSISCVEYAALRRIYFFIFSFFHFFFFYEKLVFSRISVCSGCWSKKETQLFFEIELPSTEIKKLFVSICKMKISLTRPGLGLVRWHEMSPGDAKTEWPFFNPQALPPQSYYNNREGACYLKIFFYEATPKSKLLK